MKAELKTSELRINNLLRYEGTEDIAKVNLIHGDNHFDCRDEFGSFTPNGTYEPITLTEEWLIEKMGFTKHNDGGYVYQLSRMSNLHIDIGESACIFGFEHEYEAGEYPVLGRKFKFVHEVQNVVYELCGTHLVIIY